jgi:hypothetical protein
MRPLLALIVVLFFAQPALAFHCPVDMAEIDTALAADPQISAEQLVKVKELRAEGETLHKAGNHQRSVDVLQEAKDILGLK